MRGEKCEIERVLRGSGEKVCSDAVCTEPLAYFGFPRTALWCILYWSSFVLTWYEKENKHEWIGMKSE
jgi:hypothetical protein